VTALLLSAVTFASACERASKANQDDPALKAEPATPDSVNQDGIPVALAPEARAAWRVRELHHLPTYFQLSGWKDATTVFGRAGCNPVDLRIDAPQYITWNLNACGDAILAPDRLRIAWGDGKGVMRVGERGQRQRLIFDRVQNPNGEGDATGLAIWSPDGNRILTSWAAEWQSFYGIVDVTTAEITPLTTRLEGYFLTSAWDWLDADRILFTTQAARDSAGRSEYSEAGGYRTDLAVYDLRDQSYRKATEVEDSVFLRPLGKWSSTELLVGEGRSRHLITRFWIYDTRNWARRAAPITATGSDALVADSSQILIIDRRSAPTGEIETRLMLWQRGGLAPLATVRGNPNKFAWSTDQQRIAIGTTIEAPVAGAAGSFVTQHLAYVLEPR
jgi:hypothetical protein